MVAFLFKCLTLNGQIHTGSCTAESIDDVLNQIAEWWGWVGPEKQYKFSGNMDEYRVYTNETIKCILLIRKK